MPSYNQKEFTESNVNYLNKDFTSFKSSLIDYAKAYFPNSYKDFNETSPGMMLMEMSAYVGDVMSFYIDQQYREMILPLSEERRNVVNLAKMLGYKVKPIVPAYVDLTFTQNVPIATGKPAEIDYSKAGTWDKGITVSSNTDSSLVFQTLDVLDFSLTSSQAHNSFVSNDTVSPNTDATTGLATSYTLSRQVRAISAETKTTTFNIERPTKYLKLTLPDTNVIDILSVKDSNGNDWYEVEFLAQDKVPVEKHYTADNRLTAYVDLEGSSSNVPVPYSLQYIKTNKRYTTEVNVDNTTSLVFGIGIMNSYSRLNDGFLDIEQAGIIVPGQTTELESAIDPLIATTDNTLGEAPSQTVLTVSYRVGGGLSSNVSVNDLETIESSTLILEF